MNSGMLIPSGNVRVAIVLHLLITPLKRGIRQGDSVPNTGKSQTQSSLLISAFCERGSDCMICNRILTLYLI